MVIAKRELVVAYVDLDRILHSSVPLVLAYSNAHVTHTHKMRAYK